MKKHLIRTVLFFLIWISCKENNLDPNTYKLNGVIKNVPDSTVVVLSNRVFVDSSLTKNQTFYLSGIVTEPIKAVLTVKGSNENEYKQLWIEKEKIFLEGEYGKFEYALIEGGKNQDTANLFEKEILPIRKSIDSLSELLSANRISKDSMHSYLKELNMKETQITQEFIRSYPNALESIFLLNFNKRTWNKDLLVELFSFMNLQNKETYYGKSLSNYLELNKNLQVNDDYIDFEQRDVHGNLVKLSELRGNYTLLDFWASWCIPCRKQNPKFHSLYSKFNKYGFNIVSISLDEREVNWKKAIEEDSLIWDQLTDLKGKENKAVIIYNIDAIPDNILIDDNGIIVGKNLSLDTLEKKLETRYNKDLLNPSQYGVNN